jgi:V/A-type H+-transporting ATPase subunit K
MSGIGAGIAVAYVGAAAVGAISEKPEVAGKTILYVGLAEGIAILGFGIAFIILSKVQ